jgi:hypothetical protein
MLGLEETRGVGGSCWGDGVSVSCSGLCLGPGPVLLDDTDEGFSSVLTARS